MGYRCQSRLDSRQASMLATIPLGSMGSLLEMASQLSMKERGGKGPMVQASMSARRTIQAAVLAGLNISLSWAERMGHS